MNTFSELKRDTLARQLRQHIAGEVRFDTASRKIYSTDASIYQIEPLGVVLPRTADDLTAAVQIASEMEVPITARGGGTSLSGQAIGPGIVLDCSKFLTGILHVDPEARMARVQPGVVLDQLNRALLPHGLWFGPDVSTANRANLGGMIGNNSAGSRSIVYGKTIDHVHRLKVILSDGACCEFGLVTESEWTSKAEQTSLEGGIYRRVREIVARNAKEIRQRFPRILRRVSGYNLDAMLDGGSLHHLIVGSEGTLAVIAEAEIQLVPRPKYRGLLVPQFATLAAAMDALAACLEPKPSAVELMDQMLLDLARANPGLKDHMAAVEGRPEALLMVEFSGDDKAEVADKVERLRRRLMKEAYGLTAAVPALDPALRDPLWDLRRKAMPLLYGMPGDRKPITFVEDTAVSPERLPEFVQRFRETLRKHGTDGAFYGHASVGCLHIRPVLNLKDTDDVARMRRIAEEVTDLVLEYGGSLSGEHGDGLARSEWNAKMFGPVVYEAFRQIKQAFDPRNLLNPGKVVDAPAMTENLRYGQHYQPIALPTVFDYSQQEGFVRSIEMCNGSGACRKLQGGTMCPSYRATCEEADSTRGRANALRTALSGEQPLKALRSRWVYDVLDLCLMCKACKTECPSSVDMAKIKAEFLHLYYRGRPRPLGHYLMGAIHHFNRLSHFAAPVVNWLQRRPVFRWLMEMMAGIDRRRSLPLLHRDHFRRWLARHQENERRGSSPASPKPRTLLLMADCFTCYNEPQIGQAAVQVLEHAGYQVELANLQCCGRALISKGFLNQARKMAETQLPALAERVADGTPLLGLEPSCLLTLADEWPDLVPSDAAKRVAAAAELADVWLAKEVQAGRCQLPLRSRAEKCVLHGHCHQKALGRASGSAAALRLVPELDVTVLDTGCCGMAGSFGYEKEHFDLSARIAELSVLPALRESPEAIVAAPGTSCRHQIKDLAHRRAWHPLEVLFDQLPQ